MNWKYRLLLLFVFAFINAVLFYYLSESILNYNKVLTLIINTAYTISNYFMVKNIVEWK